MNDIKVTNSFGFAVAAMVPAEIVSAFYFSWPQATDRGTGDNALLAYPATS